MRSKRSRVLAFGAAIALVGLIASGAATAVVASVHKYMNDDPGGGDPGHP